MTPSTVDDFRWLISEEAAPILIEVQDAIEVQINALQIAKKLRKQISPERSALVMEQANLRIRAKKKFSHPEKMFFTRRGLEQSSGKLIAQYKAMRFAGLANVADICCGIGGDLIGLAKRGVRSSCFDPTQLRTPKTEQLDPSEIRTIGVDADELTSLFARRNLEASGLDSELHCIEQVDFDQFAIDSMDGIHIDPDRRMKDRTVRGNHFSPSLQSIYERVSDDCSLAIKVAPATPTADYYPQSLHREWIGDHRECKQQVLWSGPFSNLAGYRTATYIGRNGLVSQISIEESKMDRPVQMFDSIYDFIYEPHSAVLAAGMTDVIARQYGLRRFTSQIVYLTGDQVIDDPLLSRFQVLQILPMSLRKTIKILRSLEVGVVELKKRGIDNVTVEQYGRMKLDGPNKATVILTRLGNTRIAIIAKRKGNDLQIPDVADQQELGPA